MSDNDLTPLQQLIYSDGTDPVEYAVWLVKMHLETMADILEARKSDPGAYPIVRLPVTLDSTVRKILGGLIDAGWQPPTVRPTPDNVSAIAP